MPDVLAVCLNPTFQRTFVVPHLWEDEVNRSPEYYYDVAGKGLNTARILTQLGVSAMHLTHIGGEYGQQYLSHNVKEHIMIATIETETEIRTCYTIINNEEHTTTEIVEEAPAVGPDAEEKVLARFRDLLKYVKIVTISGSKSPGYSDELYPIMVREAKEQGKIVVLDIRGKVLLDCMPYKPDYINPNYPEFAFTFLPDLPVKEHGDDEEVTKIIKQKMLEVKEEFGATCVVTHGPHPTLFVDEGEIREAPVKKITPINTIGSGDAFTAGFVSVILNGGTIEEAVKKGQECGSLNAMKIRPGTIK